MRDERGDWFDEGNVSWQAPGEKRLPPARLATGPDAPGGPLTRLWQDVDPGRQTGAEAVAALRERKRTPSPARRRRWWRG